MTHKEMMNIKYETCDLWNSLKDKSKIVDTLIDLKEQNLKLKAELAELKQNAIVPKFKVCDVLWYIRCDKVEKFIVYEVRCDCVFYYVNEYGEDVDEYKLFATQAEAEEALQKMEEV